MATTDYRKMSIAEKEAHTRTHAPPHRCPGCGMQIDEAELAEHRAARCTEAHNIPMSCPECEQRVPVEDLADHIAHKCKGRPEPHPKARWVDVRQAKALGITRRALYKQATKGKIRQKGEMGHKRFLVADIGKFLSRQIAREKKRKANGLTKRRESRRNTPMIKDASIQNRQTGADTLRDRLSSYVESVGGYSKAARKLDIPRDTIQRVTSGANVREGTALLVRARLEEANKG